MSNFQNLNAWFKNIFFTDDKIKSYRTLHLKFNHVFSLFFTRSINWKPSSPQYFFKNPAGFVRRIVRKNFFSFQINKVIKVKITYLRINELVRNGLDAAHVSQLVFPLRDLLDLLLDPVGRPLQLLYPQLRLYVDNKKKKKNYFK